MCAVSDRRASAPDDELTIGLTSAVTEGPARPGHSDRPQASDFAPGAIIASRYRLVALLGRGGMGEVYRADDLTLDQWVTLKGMTQTNSKGKTQNSKKGIPEFLRVDF